MLGHSYLVSVAKPSASHIYFIGRAPQIRTEIERILSALPLPIRIVREIGPDGKDRTSTLQILMVGTASDDLASLLADAGLLPLPNWATSGYKYLM